MHKLGTNCHAHWPWPVTGAYSAVFGGECIFNGSCQPGSPSSCLNEAVVECTDASCSCGAPHSGHAISCVIDSCWKTRQTRQNRTRSRVEQPTGHSEDILPAAAVTAGLTLCQPKDTVHHELRICTGVGRRADVATRPAKLPFVRGQPITDTRTRVLIPACDAQHPTGFEYRSARAFHSNLLPLHWLARPHGTVPELKQTT